MDATSCLPAGCAYPHKLKHLAIPMRIAFVSTILGYDWGGADKPWTHAAEIAQRDGHPILLLVSPRVARHPRIAAIARTGAHLVQRRQLSGTASGRQWLRRLLGRDDWPRVRVALEDFGPDVLLLNQGGVFDFTLEHRLIAWCRKRHLPILLYCNCNSDAWSLGAEHRAFTREIFADAASVFFVSTHNWRLAERQLAMSIDRAQVIQNPIDDSLRTSPPPWPSTTVPACAVVARIDAHHKGLDILIPALAAAWPSDVPWVINLYGTGPDEDYVIALARRYGLADRIRLLGFTSDIRKIWAHNHLMLMPSRHEGCSIAMLEALACGRAVVATAVGGVSDWITDGVNGFVCPAPTVDLLVSTLIQTWSTRSRWAELGANAGRLYQARCNVAPENQLFTAMTASIRSVPHS